MMEPLKEGDGGHYGELTARRRDGDLALVFMPSLAALFGRAEELKGSSLTENEAVLIRDRAIVVAMPADVAAAVAEQRGYADVDAADPWKSWQALRGSE